MAKQQSSPVADDLGSPAKAFLITLASIATCGVAAAGFIALAMYLRAHHAGFWPVTGSILAYGAVIVAISSVTAKLGRRAMCRGQSAAAKRYSRRMMIAISLYVVALTGAITAFVRLHPTGPLAYLLAVAPALPIVATIVIMGLYLREETDEFERTVQMESALWAIGGVLVVATVWGFLEMFKLVPHIDSWAVFPAWAALLGPAQIIARRRYQ